MTIAKMIQELSFEYDRFDYESKDFLPHDEMTFARRVLMEKLLDGLYFLRYGGKNGIDSEINAQNKKSSRRKTLNRPIPKRTPTII